MREMRPTLLLPNIFDYNSSVLATNAPARVRKHWTDVGNALADLAVFWDDRDKILISPIPVKKPFIKFVEDVLGFGKIINLSPDQISDYLIENLINDAALMQNIASMNIPDIKLMAWGATPSMVSLLDKFAAFGISIDSSELPSKENIQNVAYLDSKSGFRSLYKELSQSHKSIMMPQGFVCGSITEVLSYIRYFFNQNKGCYVKANHGVNGIGLIQMMPEWSKHSDKVIAQYIQNQMADSGVMIQHEMIVVEEVIRSILSSEARHKTIGSLFMNAFIDEDGQIDILGSGNELRDKMNHYIGAEMGKDSLGNVHLKSIESIMESICLFVYDFGYHGHLGVDFVLNEAKSPIVLELNARRSSESSVYDIAAKLFGKDWASRYSALVRLPRYVTLSEAIDIEKILEIVNNLNQSIANEDTIVVPLCLSWMELAEPALGYVIFSSNIKNNDIVERRLFEKLNSFGVHARY